MLVVWMIGCLLVNDLDNVCLQCRLVNCIVGILVTLSSDIVSNLVLPLAMHYYLMSILVFICSRMHAPSGRCTSSIKVSS